MDRKKKVFAVVAVFLLLLGDYLYWSIPFSFGKVLPQESWTKVQLWYYDEHFDSREILVEEEWIERILTTAAGTTVTNRPRFRTMSQPFFYLFLYHPNGYTRITVVENGDIDLNPRISDQRELYYDGGEELFAVLKGVMERSPAVFPVE